MFIYLLPAIQKILRLNVGQLSFAHTNVVFSLYGVCSLNLEMRFSNQFNIKIKLFILAIRLFTIYVRGSSQLAVYGKEVFSRYVYMYS